MNVRRYDIMALAAAGLLVGGAAALPAAAQAGPDTGIVVGNGGSMMGGGVGYAARPGFCGPFVSQAPAGTLTATQRTRIAALAEQAKLVRDLSTAFAERYDADVFAHLSMSGTRHLETLRILLDRYGIADPTSGLPAGAFADRSAQAVHARLLAAGSTGRGAGLRAAQQVERTYLDELRAALVGLTAADVRQSYLHLAVAAEHSLRMLTTWSRR